MLACVSIDDGAEPADTYMTTKNFMLNNHSPTHYTYNANGAVVTDANKGVVYTEYDSMYGLEMYDYGARLYDPLVGRWFCVDPLTEKYYSISPYVYCHQPMVEQ